jgi:hypothetical protein
MARKRGPRCFLAGHGSGREHDNEKDDAMETLIAFVAGAASAITAVLLAPQAKKVDLAKAVAPVRQVLVEVIAAAYRASDAATGATAGVRKELSKLVDEGRERARKAEPSVGALPAAPETH